MNSLDFAFQIFWKSKTHENFLSQNAIAIIIRMDYIVHSILILLFK